MGKDELQDFQLEVWKEAVPQNPIAPDSRAMKYSKNQGVLVHTSTAKGWQGDSGSRVER